MDAKKAAIHSKRIAAGVPGWCICTAQRGIDRQCLPDLQGFDRRKLDIAATGLCVEYRFHDGNALYYLLRLDRIRDLFTPQMAW